MERYKYALPVEQWRQVLVNNSHRDLCNVVLTSKYMNSVASLPELWAGMKVNRRKVLENGLAEFYNINRFKKVKEFNFKSWVLKDEELDRLLNEIPGSHLESINLRHINLSGVSAELLARAVSHLYIVNLSKTWLKNDQCVTLLKASLSSTTLAKVNLAMVNLSEVPAELLASSISRLQDVNVAETGITTKQCVALLKATLSSTDLAKVNLSEINLSKVPSELLASSISRLQDVNLAGTGITIDQCIALLKASLSSTTLANVDLLWVNLSEVPAELLGSSISGLQDVSLSGTKITTEQCIALLKASLSSTILSKINLSDINLSKVPAELLASSISRLQDVNLSVTGITSDQCVALLKASLSSTTLANVNLWRVNLSEVPAELLASSISKLKYANLCLTRITSDQCVALMKASLSSKKLAKIFLMDINLIKVPAELLASSMSQLQDVHLGQTRITTKQCVALLKASLSSTTLAYVNLDWVILSEVPAELLASSISRLQDVSLRGTRLTTSQYIALLKVIFSSRTLHRIDLQYNDTSKFKITTDQPYLLSSLPGHVKVKL